MPKAHGRAETELEQVGADPNVDDAEEASRKDTWFGPRSHGWFDALLRRWESS